MQVIEQLLSAVELPKMAKVRQHFDAKEIQDIPSAIQLAFQEASVLPRIAPGDRIAIAVGSRGVAEIATITREVVRAVKSAGGEPFIFPAMGSHGGATAEGQRSVLEHMGVTEESIEAPIRATMDTVEVGRLESGMPVYLDRYAHEADKIIVINRVKPHTAFRGQIESGLMKMLTIGLGKQKGAETVHAPGFKYMAENVWQIGSFMLQKLPIVCGVATIENAFDRPAYIGVIPAERIAEAEPELLATAREWMPSIRFNPLDVLVVDEIGKDISGDGMDPNITGRFPTPYATGGIDAARVAVLDLTTATDGNINGLGLADITTRKVFDRIQWEKGYANALTSTVVNVVKVPMFLETAEMAVKAAIRTCNAADPSRIRMVRIKNTLHIQDIWISEALLDEARAMGNVEVLSAAEHMRFI